MFKPILTILGFHVHVVTEPGLNAFASSPQPWDHWYFLQSLFASYTTSLHKSHVIHYVKRKFCKNVILNSSILINRILFGMISLQFQINYLVISDFTLFLCHNLGSISKAHQKRVQVHIQYRHIDVLLLDRSWEKSSSTYTVQIHGMSMYRHRQFVHNHRISPMTTYTYWDSSRFD